MASSHSDDSRPPYRAIQGSPRSCASALTRSACGWAAWCFHSFTYACGRSRHSGSPHSGVPSDRVGSTVHAVKSVPMPTTSAAETPLAATAFGTASLSTSR